MPAVFLKIWNEKAAVCEGLGENRSAPRSIPIPGKDNDEVAIGTLMSILRQAGLDESDFDKI